MYSQGYKILNLKNSLMLSLFSGTGFIALLAFFPIKKTGVGSFPDSPKIEEINIQRDNLNQKGKKYTRIVSEKEEEKYFRTIPSSIFKSQPGSKFLEYGINPADRFFENGTLQQPLQNQRNMSGVGDFFAYYKDDKMQVSAQVDRNYSPSMSDSKGLNKQIEFDQVGRTTTLKSFDLNYKIDQKLTATIRTNNYDTFDDRFKLYPTTTAGLSLSDNKYITSGFIAGDSNFTNSLRYTNSSIGNVANYYYVREMDQNLKDTDRNRNLFEWQTNISPTKNLQFQTAIFNSNRFLLNNDGPTSEGARFAMFLGVKNLVFNLRYNYLSDNLLKSMYRPDSFANTRDYAAVGITVYLDPSKRYSLYVANHINNIAVPTRPDQSNQPGANAFSASIRAKNPVFMNSTFFFNFRNQQNKDNFYSNFGLFRLPVYSQSYIEYATALGLELSF